MIRIRFEAPTTAHVQMQAGDELLVQALTPEVLTLLNAQRLDGVHVARIVRGREEIVADRAETGTETATVPRRSRSSSAA